VENSSSFWDSQDLETAAGTKKAYYSESREQSVETKIFRIYFVTMDYNGISLVYDD
jgi:hypothetical protein